MALPWDGLLLPKCHLSLSNVLFSITSLSLPVRVQPRRRHGTFPSCKSRPSLREPPRPNLPRLFPRPIPWSTAGEPSMIEEITQIVSIIPLSCQFVGSLLGVPQPSLLSALPRTESLYSPRSLSNCNLGPERRNLESMKVLELPTCLTREPLPPVS